MGKINIAGFALSLGAVGQALLLAHWIGSVSLLVVALLGPYLLVHVISFCRVAPCGPGRFAQILIIAMAWYSFDTFACELVWLLAPTRRSDTIVAAIAHALCYGSAISFIVLIPAVRDARNHQTTPT